MKFAKLLAVGVLFAGTTAMANPIGLIDDFSDTDVSEYTVTVILDTDTGGGANATTLQSPSGALQLGTATYQSIEQSAITRSGVSLDVGEELLMDITHTGDSQDMGLYVGGTTPVANVRQDYVAVYLRGNGQVFSRGFDGSSEYPLAGGGTPAVESLFIARTALNTYEAGYYEGGVRNIVTTRTPSFANAGTVVGFYTDVRAAGVLGDADNLRITPEPASLALLGLGGLALFRRK